MYACCYHQECERGKEKITVIIAFSQPEVFPLANSVKCWVTYGGGRVRGTHLMFLFVPLCVPLTYAVTILIKEADRFFMPNKKRFSETKKRDFLNQIL